MPRRFRAMKRRKPEGNDNVVIWDVTWEKGKSTGMRQLPLDQISVFLTDGAIKLTRSDGTWSIEEERLGSVRYEPKGTVIAEEGVGGMPIRAAVFQLKDGAPAKRPTTEALEVEYPRPGAVKLFETDRINVWDMSWNPGVQGPLHLHDSQTAAALLAKERFVLFRSKACLPRLCRGSWETCSLVVAPQSASYRGTGRRSTSCHFD